MSSAPSSAWTTLEVRAWLRERDVEFDPSDSHLALCALAAVVADGGVAEESVRHHRAAPPQFDAFGNLLVQPPSEVAPPLEELDAFGWPVRYDENGERIVQETRLWDEGKQLTKSMRSKEGASDYRYFPDPDLGPIEVSADQRESWRSELPELPAAKRHRYAEELGLSQYDARVLTDERPMADYFESVVTAGADAKLAANWITGDIAAYVNSNRLSYGELPFRPEQLAEMVQLIDGGKISGKIAKEILPDLLEKGGSPKALVDERGLGMISDPAAIEAIVDELLTAHPDEVEAFRGGKTKLQGFFVGQLMKKTGGKADPKLANQILSRRLKGE